MKGKGILIILAIVVIIGGLFASNYNQMMVMNVEVDGAWSQVENQLKRRADQIPNLVEIVKGYASHEKETIETITDARAKYAGANSPEEYEEAERSLNTAINVVVENYPDLKADGSFRDLQAELTGTENRLAVARMDYNEKVEEYNKMVLKFPKNIFAKILGFEKREYFKVSDKDMEVPKIEF